MSTYAAKGNENFFGEIGSLINWGSNCSVRLGETNPRVFWSELLGGSKNRRFENSGFYCSNIMRLLTFKYKHKIIQKSDLAFPPSLTKEIAQRYIWIRFQAELVLVTYKTLHTLFIHTIKL